MAAEVPEDAVATTLNADLVVDDTVGADILFWPVMFICADVGKIQSKFVRINRQMILFFRHWE